MISLPLNIGVQLLVLLLGLVTSYTDFTEKKIKNSHLIIFGVAAIVLELMQAKQDHALGLTALLNVAIATLVAILLFISDMWRGGDAKLFILYSLLMIPTGQEAVFLASPIVLFVSTFFAAFIIFIPFEIYASFRKHRFSPPSEEVFYWDNVKFAFLGFASFNWMIFPILHKLSLFAYPVVVGVFSSLLFPFLNRWMMKLFQRLFGHWNKGVIFAIAVGFILHLLFIPRELFWATLGRSVRSIFIFSTIFFIFKCAIDNAEVSKERVPFAPMLIIGYYLSYTGFLKTAASWIALIR